MSATAVPRPSVRRLYVWGSLAAAAVVLAGFAHSYFLKSLFGTPALSRLLHLHGLVMSAWIAVFVAQAFLVAKRRVDLHRRLGVLGAALAALVVVVGVTAGIDAAQRGASPPGVTPLVFLVVPITDMVVFTILAGAGLALRRKPELHRRLMLLSTLSMLSAAFARIVILTGHGDVAAPVAFILNDLLLLACVFYDTRLHRRLHPAFAWGSLLVIASHPFRLWFGGTDTWMSIARWLTS
jgi:hypothetical protein